MPCSAGLVEVYSLSLLSGRLLIVPSVLSESFAGQHSLGCRPLLFIIWNNSCHSLPVYSVSFEKSAASLMGALLYVTSCFSLAAFKILWPWLLWLSGLSAGLQTKGLLIRFLARAHAWVAGHVLSRGCMRSNHTLMFLRPLSFPSFSKINK